MPITRFQSKILVALASDRNPEAPSPDSPALNPEGFRNIFFGKTLRKVAEDDAEVLSQQGFDVHWLQRKPTPRAAVLRGALSAQLEWAGNSDLRFFRTVKDDVFGYRLHVFDLATNIALAAMARREPRDALDLLHVHRRHVQLGAVIWAATANDPGCLPAYVLGQISRNSQHSSDDYVNFASLARRDAADVRQEWNNALEDADSFVSAMPRGREGLAFLKDGELVQPDPAKLSDYIEHAARRRMPWPSSAEICSAMLRSETGGRSNIA
jgi:hypothetical protein